MIKAMFTDAQKKVSQGYFTKMTDAQRAEYDKKNAAFIQYFSSDDFLIKGYKDSFD